MFSNSPSFRHHATAFSFLILCTFLAFSCTPTPSATGHTTAGSPIPSFQNKGHELVYQMVQTLGTYEDLKAQNDVVYTYTYRTATGQEDVSTEKYLFDGELSLGQYSKHERTMPHLTGSITQGYDGNTVWLKQEDTLKTDSALVASANFTRGTNFFWLTMMQKLLDPSVNYKHLGTKEVNGTVYDLVDITYNMPEGKASDTYRLYVNTETHVADQFLFTVVDKGVVDEPLLMQVSYTSHGGVQLPTTRKYTRSNWEGDILKDVWAEEICTDIRMNTGLSAKDFLKS